MILGFHLHFFFGLVFFVGVILFLLWASKLKPDELKTWAIRALVLGIVGALLTASLGHSGKRWHKGKYMDRGDGKIEKMMDRDGVEEIITPGELSLAE